MTDEFMQPDVDEILRLIEEDKERQQTEEAIKWRAKQKRVDLEAEKRVAEEAAPQRTIKLTSLDSLTPKRTAWLWDQRIPLGEVSLVAGRGGIGKSLFLNTAAAWLTTGTMRGEFEGKPQNVIYIANEDSYEHTVLPRLMAAGADLARVFRLDIRVGEDEGRLILPSDCDVLKAAVRDTDAVAVFIDPLSSNMADKDRNSPEVRTSYERLRRLAEELRIAIIGNGHIKKGQIRDIQEGFMGSSEIGNVARAIIGVVRDPDSDDPQVILSQCKNNYGRSDLRSYTYKIVEEQLLTGNGVIAAPRLIWGESTDRHVDEIVSEGVTQEGSSDIAEAVEWLQMHLTTVSGTSRPQIVHDALKAGIKEHTLKRAAKRLKVVSRLEGFPATATWSLPKPANPS